VMRVAKPQTPEPSLLRLPKTRLGFVGLLLHAAVCAGGLFGIGRFASRTRAPPLEGIETKSRTQASPYGFFFVGCEAASD